MQTFLKRGFLIIIVVIIHTLGSYDNWIWIDVQFKIALFILYSIWSVPNIYSILCELQECSGWTTRKNSWLKLR